MSPPVASWCEQSRDNLHPEPRFSQEAVLLPYFSPPGPKVVQHTRLPLSAAAALSFCFLLTLLANYRLWCSNFSTADYYPSDVAVSLKATLKGGLEFSFWSCIDAGSESEGDFLCHHIFSFFPPCDRRASAENRRGAKGPNNATLRSGALSVAVINSLTSDEVAFACG